MILGCIRLHLLELELLSLLTDMLINAKMYTDLLEDNLWPVIARHFSENNSVSSKTTMLEFTELILSWNIG